MSEPNKAIYPLYQAGERGLKAYFNLLAATTAVQAQMLEAFGPATLIPQVYKDAANKLAASSEVLSQLGKEYTKPAFGLTETVIDGATVGVTEEAVLKKDFCTVLHFKRDTRRNDPKVLIVAAMSGHYATQFRDTIASLLPDHDVYIMDWKNARDVPLDKGAFGFDDYVAQVEEAIAAVGPETHVLAVSQSTVPVLAAVSLLAAKKSPVQPLSMTLMGGPIDIRAAKTAVTEFVKGKTIEWFKDRLIAEVPRGYAGEGRAVYPGFLQLAALMSVNPQGHIRAYADLFNHLSEGRKEKAAEIKAFYNEYLSVCDLTEKFYLDTLAKVFLKQELADGTLKVNGEKVSPEKIKNTALMTVEG
ncbi:MAG: polyhydroxyalkanoate depolymerase, partial [Alphaproteobacteria bacterium]|nr:polyhydroxyalkanoate depolymerase [Alphaproteobacteria bacterium]